VAGQQIMSAYGFYQNCAGTQTFPPVDPQQWSSSKSSVASVNGETITGQSGGTATITATYTDRVDSYNDSTCSYTLLTMSARSSATVQIPASVKLVSTTSQGAGSCAAGYAGWQRHVLWQVLDQFGQPIDEPMDVSDSIANGLNQCGLTPITGSATTNGSGQFSDYYFFCSTGCVGRSCQTDASQTYTVNATYKLSVVSIVYLCVSITLNGA
jgi:hypothetical protein